MAAICGFEQKEIYSRMHIVRSINLKDGQKRPEVALHHQVNLLLVREFCIGFKEII